jgi:hypothetical protein
MGRSSAAGRGCKGRIRPEVPQNHRSAACAGRFRSLTALGQSWGAPMGRTSPAGRLDHSPRPQEQPCGWPASNRNAGRLRVGMGGRLQIGMTGRLRRNSHVGQVGDAELVRAARLHVFGQVRENRPAVAAVGGHYEPPLGSHVQILPAHDPGHPLVVDLLSLGLQLRRDPLGRALGTRRRSPGSARPAGPL